MSANAPGPARLEAFSDGVIAVIITHRLAEPSASDAACRDRRARLACANLGFLFFLSLLPLSTAYAVDKGLSGLAVAVYATSLLIVVLAFLCFRLTMHGHLSRRGPRNHLLSLAVYSACIAGMDASKPVHAPREDTEVVARPLLAAVPGLIPAQLLTFYRPWIIYV